MSGRGNTYNGAPPKYINDFSKALASEVRILLAEVGRLRDERRQLQYEISELMSSRSKQGAGGEYTPDWRPKGAAEPPQPTPAPPPPPESATGDAPTRPAWRTVNKREELRQKAKAKVLPAPEAVRASEPPAPNLPAWAQWKPNPLLSPEPRLATAGAPLPVVPGEEGLFGPPTPPPV
ncbi:hypothetical protein BKA93DRAFT_624543 [Sparassis latifolia]|uniref:Uncharacterized protein n=1 Tax=Sparassis crispa TaxID=139825 RepID=A0A401H665_9APHY|nr:predicted protein [Sparassis crispa]GBE89850.1 predicted protein [Sparassis crispa]